MIKILKFGTSWCTQCQALAQNIKGLQLPIEEIDADENDELTEKYDVLSVPVLIFIDENGTEKDRILGNTTADIIVEKYNQLNV